MPLNRREFLLAGSGALAATALGAAPARAAVTQGQLHSFGYQGVQLLPSRWRSQQEDVLTYYLDVPTDDYLIGFRRRAGQPKPSGNELGGWYSKDIFNPFGQILSGLARFAVALDSDEARSKVHAIVDGFTSCIADDGFFYYSDAPNALHYGYDKVLCGLLDAWLFCGDDTARQAMDAVTEWAVDPEHLDREHDYAYVENPLHREWYTLSENLYRAFIATGDQRYADFARVWEYREFWDRFYRHEDWFQTPDGELQDRYHAYSHVNSLTGLGAGFAATGDEYYVTALRNAYTMVRHTQCFAPGGYGPYERLDKDRSQLAQDIWRGPWTFETQCGSWAALKFSKYLVQATGNAWYGGWAEEMLYNAVGATIQMGSDGGVMYHSNYASRGGVKRNIRPWSCCSGTRPQAIADYTDQVFLHSADRLCINLFLPASVRWQTGDGVLSAHIETQFPADDTVTLVIDGEPSAEIDVAFRRPRWIAGTPTLTINGAPVDPLPDENNWIAVRRSWSPGTRVTVTLPAELRSRRFLRDQPFPTAIDYGPVTLAFQTEDNPVTGGSDADLLGRLHRDGTDLQWTLDGRPDTTVRPFYAVPADERYYLYVDPNAGLYIDLPSGWRSVEKYSDTQEDGLSARCTFVGTGVRFRFKRFLPNGFAEVAIDGGDPVFVDQYGNDPGADDFRDFRDLGQGSHTITVTCRHAAPDRTYINIVDLEIIE